MKIKLKKLTLVNFKGAVNKTLDFADNTFIFGDNATGKTTIFDAFTWLLFGKDSAGRSDFEIKTLDSRGHAIPQIDHEVIGVLEIDGKEITFRRVLREKWVKKRGFEDTSFEGNETIYFIDGVPKKKNEYETYISDLIDENLFKLITSPVAFNEIKWNDRRNMLVEIAGGIDQDEIISSMDADADQKQWVINLLASDDKLEDQKKRIAAQIKAEKDELKMIPTRIDEANRQKPETPPEAFDVFRNDLGMQKELLTKIDSQIQDKNKAFDGIVDKVNGKKRELYAVASEIDKIEQDLKAEAKRVTTVDTSEIDKLNKDKGYWEQEVDALESKITESNNRDTELRSQIASLDIQQDNKRKDWSKINAEEFNPDDKKCPTCGAEKTAEQLKSLLNDFSETKKDRLDKINEQGKAMQTDKEMLFKSSKNNEENQKEHQKEIAKIKAMIDGATKQLDLLATPVDKIPETQDHAFVRLVNDNKELKKSVDDHSNLEKEIAELEKSMQNPEVDSLKEKRTAIVKEIDELKAILLKETSIKQIEGRITDLKNQESTLAQSIASTERDLFLIDKYTKSSIEHIELQIDKMFDIVRFKMFEQHISGGESETCICTVDGVPYSDLNQAMKINAGLDVINTLSTHYKVTAPIFVDGRESVVKLIETDSQIINLVVSADDKELRIR